jgi:hypothetical protein
MSPNLSHPVNRGFYPIAKGLTIGSAIIASLMIVALVAVCAALLSLGGCAYVPTSQQQVIDAQATNAHAFNVKVQALPTATDPNAGVPAAIKVWSQGEDDSWQAMSAWAHGQAPANSTTPPAPSPPATTAPASPN